MASENGDWFDTILNSLWLLIKTIFSGISDAIKLMGSGLGKGFGLK